MPESLPCNPPSAVAGIHKWSILAGVRFLLASVVAINHLGAYTSLGCLAFIPKFGPFEAILGFLLISGYSISVSYTKQPDGFFGRRIQRLFPVYLVAIAATYVAGLMEGNPPPSILSLVVNALFLNQLLTSDSFVIPAWSLSLEFWLYCLAPVLVRAPPARTRLLIYASFAAYVIYTPLRSLLNLPFYSGVGFGANLIFLSFIWIAGLRLGLVQGERATAMRDIRILLGGHILLATGIQFVHRAKHHALPDFLRHDLAEYAMQFATLVAVYLVFAHLVIASRPVVRRSWLLRFMGDVLLPSVSAARSDLHFPQEDRLGESAVVLLVRSRLVGTGVSGFRFLLKKASSTDRNDLRMPRKTRSHGQSEVAWLNRITAAEEPLQNPCAD